MEHWPGQLMGGSLPLDKRLDGLGGTAAAPVAMLAPVHLVASRPLALGRSATLTGVGGPGPPVPTISGPAGDLSVPSSAAGDGHLSAGAEADPVGARVGGLLAEAAAPSLTTVKPADATYDFDEYALLAAGSPGEGLFPPPAKQQIAQTILSVKVHGQLSAILAGLNAGYKAGRTTPELTVVVDQLQSGGGHGEWRVHFGRFERSEQPELFIESEHFVGSRADEEDAVRSLDRIGGVELLRNPHVDVEPRLDQRRHIPRSVK